MSLLSPNRREVYISKRLSKGMFYLLFSIIRTSLGHWPTVKIFSNLVKFSPSFSNIFGAYYCAESVSPQHDSGQSQSSRSMIMRVVMWTFQILFKGTVTMRFLTSFFIFQSLPGPLSNELTYFWFWFRFRWVFFYTALIRSPRGIRLRGS